MAMGTTIYASLDSMHDENPPKTTAIRKMVGTIIDLKKEGGDGKKLKNT